MMNVSAPDILAFTDVLNELAEEADGASLPRLLELEDALVEVARMLKNTQSLITTAMLQQTREPRRVGSTIYHAETVGKWRPDHRAIRNKVIGRAVYDDDGELIHEPYIAATRAVEICYSMFVSPSSMPKKEGLREIGVEPPEVAEWENTGFELKRDRVKEAPQ